MNWKWKYGLTGLAILIAQGACETTKRILITRKGVCGIEDSACDTGIYYPPGHTCYQMVQNYFKENPNVNNTTSSSGCASTGSGYRSSSSSSDDRDSLGRTSHERLTDRLSGIPDKGSGGRKGHHECP